MSGSIHRDCVSSAGIAFMAGLAIFEAQRAKVKKEDEDEKKGVKREAPTSSTTASPNKKLASDLEKKIKALPGDTTLVKAG